MPFVVFCIGLGLLIGGFLVIDRPELGLTIGVGCLVALLLVLF